MPPDPPLTIDWLTRKTKIYLLLPRTSRFNVHVQSLNLGTCYYLLFCYSFFPINHHYLLHFGGCFFFLSVITCFLQKVPFKKPLSSTSRICLHKIYSKNKQDRENPGNRFVHSHRTTCFRSINYKKISMTSNIKQKSHYCIQQ